MPKKLRSGWRSLTAEVARWYRSLEDRSTADQAFRALLNSSESTSESPPEVEHETISAKRAWSVIHSSFRNFQPLNTDRNVRCFKTLKDLYRFLQYSKLNTIRYVAEYWDCDDFAQALKAQAHRHYRINGIGYVIDHAAGHAYNLAVLGDGQLVVIEPQSDRVFKFEEIQNGQPYGGDSGYILL